MEQQKPQIPSLKDSQKPQVKIKGLQAGLSLIDRLKQFKKKDLMFISAGLGVLFMAPLAEHLLMAPEQGRGNAMTEGWSFGKNDGLGTNASPYESGINGLAPGGVTGGGDIITPLNVRDPSALVMGPGAQQQAPATNTTPAPPPAAAKEPDWKDALSEAATRGVKEATKKASLPVPKPSLTNAGLRGLGAVAGGGGGSYSPGAISSQGLAGNKAAGRDFNRVQAAPGYRGAAGARGANSGSSGSFENLKKAAGGMTDTLNRSGPASSALETAANSGMGGGAGSGIGGGGHGPDEKGPSGSQNKDSMNVGESLEFMRQKMEQEKALDLKWKLKEADAMLWPELRKDILKTLVTKPLEGLAGDIGKSFGAWGGAKGGSKDVYECDGPGGKISFNRGDVVSCRDSSVGGKEGSARYCIEGSTIRDLNLNGATYANCQIKAGEATAGSPKTEGGQGSVMPVGDAGDGYEGKSLDWLCNEIKKSPAPAFEPTSAGGDGLADLARRTLEVRNALYQGHKEGEDAACKPNNLVEKRLNAGKFGEFKLENKSGYTLKGKAAELPKVVAKGQMAAMQMLHDGELSVAKQDADVIKLRSANAATYAKQAFQKHDAKVTVPLGKDAESYEPGWVQGYKDAAKAEVDAVAAGATQKEAEDGVKKVSGEEGKPGVLKEASSWLNFSEVMLQDLKGSGSGADRVGLPTDQELKRFDDAVKELGVNNPELPQHMKNLREIVAYQRKVLAKAEGIQTSAKKVLAVKEQEKDIALTNQPGFTQLAKNSRALIEQKRSEVKEIKPVSTEKFPGGGMTFKEFFDTVEGGDAEKVSGKALPTKGDMEAYKKVRDVDLPAAQKTGDAAKIQQAQQDLETKKKAINDAIKAAADAYKKDKEKLGEGVSFVAETQAEAAGKAAEQLGSEARKIKFDYKP